MKKFLCMVLVPVEEHYSKFAGIHLHLYDDVKMEKYLRNWVHDTGHKFNQEVTDRIIRKLLEMHHKLQDAESNVGVFNFMVSIKKCARINENPEYEKNWYLQLLK